MTPSQPFRLGYLVPEFPGQTHVFFFRELRALEKMGVDVCLLSTRPPDTKIAVHAEGKAWGQKTIYLATKRPGQLLASGLSLLSNPLRVLSWLRRYRASDAEASAMAVLVGAGLIWRLSRAQHIDHVHVHSAARSALIAAAAHHIFGLSYSVTLHGPMADYGPAQALKWRDARFGLIITRRLIDQSRAEIGQDLPADIGLAPMGVELSRWQREKPYQPWTGEGPLRLVSCGRLHAAKGHHVAIEAVRRLREQDIDVQLDILGEDNKNGGYRQQLEQQIDHAGLSDSVRLRGAVDESVVRELEQQAHVFVLASKAEPLGVAIMEAMAMSLPVVVTRTGGVPELVYDGQTGILLDPEDPGAVAQAIKSLAEQPERARAMGAAARGVVVDQFSSDRSARELVAALERAGFQPAATQGEAAS